MNKIILEIGNTNIKAGFIKNDVFNKIKIYSHTEINTFLNENTFLNIKVYISSNNNDVKINIIKYFKVNNIDYYLFDNSFFKEKVNIDEKINLLDLGIDILFYLYFFKKNNITNHLGFSFGTANFCLIYENKLIGIIIMPGNELMINSIFENTDIKKMDLEETINLPINTSQSLSKGLFHLLHGSINSIIEEYKIDKIYLTGGNINFIKNDRINSSEIKTIKNILLITILDIIIDFNL